MLTDEDVVVYFKSLNYDQQRKLYGKLSPHAKSPSYALGFTLDPKGMALMGRAVQYCSNYSITYTPKKVHSKRVKFIFEDAQTRNKVFLGAMGGNNVKDNDKVEITCTFKEIEDNDEE